MSKPKGKKHSALFWILIGFWFMPIVWFLQACWILVVVFVKLLVYLFELSFDKVPDLTKVGIAHKPIDSMTGKEFEHFVTALLKRSGWGNVGVVGGANDRGADIVGYSHKKNKLVVQCKRYAATNKVSSKEMQLFVGMAKLEHKADVAVYVTSSSYTREALAIGRKHGIICIDRHELDRWVRGETLHYLQNTLYTKNI